MTARVSVFPEDSTSRGWPSVMYFEQREETVRPAHARLCAWLVRYLMLQGNGAFIPGMPRAGRATPPRCR
ncbi:hypothetical protein Q664_02990 [Archangium violaceum Cb vi76]|uniref:Uncharacterized protein n=1 Tax=Archangium violaceum Cb vi76 TaxID=1406225 RepID=A0A084T117_9BACT|nr:hypothetical protein Q664_02990 [Archangium violaceum Cb vi76]